MLLRAGWPTDNYWTREDNGGGNHWIVNLNGGNVNNANPDNDGNDNRAVCVR